MMMIHICKNDGLCSDWQLRYFYMFSLELKKILIIDALSALNSAK